MAALRAGLPVISNFGHFGSLNPNFYSHNTKIWREGVDLELQS